MTSPQRVKTKYKLIIILENLGVCDWRTRIDSRQAKGSGFSTTGTRTRWCSTGTKEVFILRHNVVE